MAPLTLTTRLFNRIGSTLAEPRFVGDAGEGLVRLLEREYPSANHADYEEAIATGFEKLVAAGRAMESPRGFVTTVAARR